MRVHQHHISFLPPQRTKHAYRWACTKRKELHYDSELHIVRHQDTTRREQKKPVRQNDHTHRCQWCWGANSNGSPSVVAAWFGILRIESMFFIILLLLWLQKEPYLLLCQWLDGSRQPNGSCHVGPSLAVPCNITSLTLSFHKPLLLLLLLLLHNPANHTT